MDEALWQRHPFEAVADSRSRMLILGSFPSVRSRAEGFYYGHPRNRFWKVMEQVLAAPAPEDTPGRAQWLLHHRIALWDVLASCEIRGSSDASIRREQPNDIPALLAGSDIAWVFANGSAAAALYRKHFGGMGLPDARQLPSTSPANASFSLPRLTAAWQAALWEALKHPAYNT